MQGARASPSPWGRAETVAESGPGSIGSRQRLGEILAAARRQQLEPGVASHRGVAPARPRVADDRGQRVAPATELQRDRGCLDAGRLQIAEDDRPSPPGEARVAGFSGDPGEPGGASSGLHDEQDMPAETRADGRLVAGELVADLGRVLGRLIDLETEDPGVAGELEGDDAVGIHMRQVRVAGERFGQPGLDRMAIGWFDRELREGGDGLDDVERVAELRTGPGAGERAVAEPTSGTRGEAEGEGSTTTGIGGQDGTFEPACTVEGGEMFLGRLATAVDEADELRGGGDVCPVEDAQGGSIADAEEACIEAHLTIGSRSRSERPDHGMGSRRSARAFTLGAGGRDPVWTTRPDA